MNVNRGAKTQLVGRSLDRRSGPTRPGGLTPPVETALWEWRVGAVGMWISDTMITGTKRGEDLRLRPLLRALLPGDRRRLYACVRAHLQGAADFFECDLRARREDGAVHDIRVCGRGIRAFDGRLIAFSGTLQAAPFALSSHDEHNLRLLHHAASNLGLAAWQLDVARGRVESCDCLRGLFSMVPGVPLESTAMLARIDAQDIDGVRASFDDVISRPERDSLTCEFRVPTADGSRRWLKTIGKVIARDDHGRALSMCGVTFDGSERRSAREKRRETNDRIEQLSRLSAMGFLASAITHEINQPLTALVNNLAACEVALRESKSASPVADLIEANKRLVQRISDIIRRTRSFVTSGEVVRVRGSMIEAIRASAAKLLLLPGNHDLHIAFNLSSEADAVDADMIQIEHVLYNLLRNAAEATESQPDRVIEVDLAVIGDDVEIHIVDNGHGLAAADYEQLFEPLWTSKESGIGLGLAVCRTVVEAHHGTISAGPGRGGRGLDMHLVLPIRAAEGQPLAGSTLAVFASR